MPLWFSRSASIWMGNHQTHPPSTTCQSLRWTHVLRGDTQRSNWNTDPRIGMNILLTLNMDPGWLQMSRNVKYISTVCIFQEVGFRVREVYLRHGSTQMLFAVQSGSSSGWHWIQPMNIRFQEFKRGYFFAAAWHVHVQYSACESASESPGKHVDTFWHFNTIN